MINFPFSQSEPFHTGVAHSAVEKPPPIPPRTYSIRPPGHNLATAASILLPNELSTAADLALMTPDDIQQLANRNLEPCALLSSLLLYSLESQAGLPLLIRQADRILRMAYLKVISAHKALQRGQLPNSWWPEAWKKQAYVQKVYLSPFSSPFSAKAILPPLLVIPPLTIYACAPTQNPATILHPHPLPYPSDSAQRNNQLVYFLLPGISIRDITPMLKQKCSRSMTTASPRIHQRGNSCGWIYSQASGSGDAPTQSGDCGYER